MTDSIEERLAVLEVHVEDLRESLKNMSHAAWGAVVGVALLVLDFLRENIQFVAEPVTNGAMILWNLVW